MIEIGNTLFADATHVVGIKDKSGTIKAKYVMGDDFIHHKYLMKENYIEFSFNLGEYVPFVRSDYFILAGWKFVMRENPEITETASNFYKYTLKFEGREMLSQDIGMYYVRQGLKEFSWSLFGTATEFAQIAVDNMNRYFGEEIYSVGTIDPVGSKLINFDSSSVWDALVSVCDADSGFECEFYFDADNTLNIIYKYSEGIEQELETDVTVSKMDRSNSDNDKVYNRIVALGSTRNIPTDYRSGQTGNFENTVYDKRLRIPVGYGDKIDAYENMTPEEVSEGTVVFDDIYPKRIGTMSEVATKGYTDTDTDTGVVTNWNAYRFKDSGITFSKDYVIAGKELRIVFQSGSLNGCDFAVKFNPDGLTDESASGAQLFEIVRNDDYGVNLPNDTLEPIIGDTYVLYGFDTSLVSEVYLPAAEQELYDKATEWLTSNLKDKSTFSCPTIITAFAENDCNFNIGRNVKLVSPRFENGNRSSRIMGFEKKLINPYDCTYTIGDNATYDSLGVTPSDDRINWFMLSMAGKSAYQIAVEGGYVGTEEAWLDSLAEPAITAAATAVAAVNSLEARYQTQIAAIKTELESTVDDAVADKTVRPLSISTKEAKIGSYTVGGEDNDIYERTVTLSNLPETEGDTTSYIIANEPLGYGIFFKVESFVASSGKGLSGNFFSEHYEIFGYAFDSSLNSIVTIKCIKSVPMATSGILHIQYCKFNGDIVEFDVTLPETVDKNSIALTIPPLKFNKKMAFSYINDDSYSIYQFLFAGINKRYVVTDFPNVSGNSQYSFHLNYNKAETTTGYTPDKFLQCTDGAGVKRRYATTVACWPDKLYGGQMGMDVGKNWPWISEKEFKYFYDFGFMLGYHDLNGYNDDTTNTQAAFDKCVDDTVVLFQNYVGLTPKVMIEPNGDHEYIDFSQGNDIIQFITAQSGDTRIKKAYPFKSDFTLDKSNITVQRLFAYGSDLVWDTTVPVTDAPLKQYASDLMNILSGFNASADKSTIYWLIGAAHRSAPWELNLFTKIHDLYGDEGLDNLWFPTLDEMYEYWFMRMNTSVVKTITATGLHFKMYVPKMPNFHFRDISVLLSGISDMTGVSVVSGDNVYGTSAAINDGKLLVNLNFDPKLIARVEKHTAAFEANYNAEYMYDNAYYFAQQLKPGLKELYLQRINVYVSPPTLSSFSINAGAANTNANVVTLNLAYTGQAPTHYMASESSDFSGASWQDYSASPSFTLSSGFNTKTVYVKLKNIYGSSGTLSDSIIVLEPPIALSSIQINGGNQYTSAQTISVALSYSGYPDYYRIGEQSDLSAKPWMAIPETDIEYTLSEGFGSKTVYVQLRNGTDDNDLSVVRSAAIEYIDATAVAISSVTINSGATTTASRDVSVAIAYEGAPTQYRIGEQNDLSGVAWQTFTSGTIAYQLTSSFGTKTIYVQLQNGSNTSNVASATISYPDPNAITLNSVLINGGDTYAASSTVTIALSITGAMTKYKVGKQSDLSDCPNWIVGNGNSISYASGVTSGNLTVYVKVANDYNEAVDIRSDSITVVFPVILGSIVLNSGADTFAGYACPVNFLITQGIPTHYRLAESTTALSGADWIVWSSSNTTFNFSTIGAKTLYAQVKNEVGSSTTVSDTITLIEPPVIILLANVATTGETVSGVGYVNPLYPGNNPIGLKDINSVSKGTVVGKYKPYNTADYTAMDTKYSINNVSGQGNPAYWGKPTLTGTGDYPNSIISDGTKTNIICPIKSNFSNFSTDRIPQVILKGLATGLYKVRILMSDNAPQASYPVKLQVQSQVVTIPTTDITSKLTKNNTNWIVFDSVEVTSDGYLYATIFWDSEPTSYPTYGHIVPICIAEITKIG